MTAPTRIAQSVQPKQDITRTPSDLRVAVIHDWLPFWGGAENVLEQILECFPGADLYTLFDFLNERDRQRLKCRSIKTSFIQNLPFARKRFWYYLPLMPYAIEQFDLSGYDLVISSSSVVAKGVITTADQIHISYVHSPVRYGWDLYHQYLQLSGYGRLRGWLSRCMLHYLRIWDLRTANGVDHYIANSRYVAKRIWKTYRREATVIYPPVDTERFTLRTGKDDFFLCASRLVSYKRVELIVEAFNAMPEFKLIVIGNGPERRRIERLASSNVTVLGQVSSEVLRDHMQRARALIFAADEDFGIAAVEAQACGTPVIAYSKGGLLEIVAEPRTGAFFREQTCASLSAAVRAFASDGQTPDPLTCSLNARRFAAARFRTELAELVDNHILPAVDAEARNASI